MCIVVFIFGLKYLNSTLIQEISLSDSLDVAGSPALCQDPKHGGRERGDTPNAVPKRITRDLQLVSRNNVCQERLRPRF